MVSFKKLQELLTHNCLSYTGTDLITLKGNRFYTTALLNREEISSLKLSVQCHVKSTKTQFSQISTKIFNFTIMDLNDNAIQVQSNHKVINVTRSKPSFQEVGGILTISSLILVVLFLLRLYDE